jgi:hypothetical protein
MVVYNLQLQAPYIKTRVANTPIKAILTVFAFVPYRREMAVDPPGRPCARPTSPSPAPGIKPALSGTMSSLRPRRSLTDFDSKTNVVVAMGRLPQHGRSGCYRIPI